MSSMKTHDELRAELAHKAAEDDGFRARLIDDPKATIEEALGLPVPEAVSVSVHQETATSVHLVLPPTAQLNDSDLEKLTGGHRNNLPYADVPHKHPWED